MTHVTLKMAAVVVSSLLIFSLAKAERNQNKKNSDKNTSHSQEKTESD